MVAEEPLTMLVAYLTHPYALKHEMGSHHPNAPTGYGWLTTTCVRKACLISCGKRPLLLPPHTILRAHTREMVDAD